MSNKKSSPQMKFTFLQATKYCRLAVNLFSTLESLPEEMTPDIIKAFADKNNYDYESVFSDYAEYRETNKIS